MLLNEVADDKNIMPGSLYTTINTTIISIPRCQENYQFQQIEEAKITTLLLSWRAFFLRYYGSELFIIFVHFSKDS
jgi:hypothetical protein